MGLTQRARVASGCVLGCSYTTTPNREQFGVLRLDGHCKNFKEAKQEAKAFCW